MVPNKPLRRSFLSASATGLTLLPLCSRAVAGAPEKIRVGQIGVAHGHASKLSIYRQSDEYEVIGIVEPNELLRQKAQKQAAFRDLPWMSQEQLLNTPGLQAVLIETRPRESLDAAQACVEAGLHIHLDKPAGESLPHFERILAVAAQKNLLVQMGYMYRYNPGIQLLKQFLRDGWLGEIFEVHAVMSKVVDPASRIELAQYPGGMMYELGCHLIDLVVGFLGEPTLVHSIARRSSTHDDNLVDNMLAVFEYPNALASVKSSALEVEGFARRHFVVCGSHGTFHIQPLDNPSVKLALSEPRGSYQSGYQEVVLGNYARYTEDAAEMARIIRGTKEPEYSHRHDLMVQRTILKASGLDIN